MCRFLMVKSQTPFQSGEILKKFADMTKNSRALDGDWQGDGWGISWISSSQEWCIKKSIQPIWEEVHIASYIPESKLTMVHARSASFPNHKNVLDYNQPYIREPYAFVFNGFLRGVSFPRPVIGNIGSQKIWNILYDLLMQFSPEESLVRTKELLKRNSRLLQAMNIGLCDKKSMYAYCYYSEHPEYYNLHIYQSPSLKIISSEALKGYDFTPVIPDKVITL